MTESQKAPSLTQISEMSQALSQTITHPAFAEIVRQIEAVPEENRREIAEAIATVEELKNRGVEIPEGFRITTRYFENPGARLRGDTVIDSSGQASTRVSGRATVCASLGLYVCVSVGES